jgi:hypothetical protein
VTEWKPDVDPRIVEACPAILRHRTAPASVIVHARIARRGVMRQPDNNLAKGEAHDEQQAGQL